MDKIDILENRISELENRVTELEKIPETHTGLNTVTEFPKDLIKKIDKTPTKNLVLILLKIEPNQSISEMTKKLLDLGWMQDTFFKKNFGTSLANKGLIRKSGNDESKKDRFSLTDKGKIIADELFLKYQS
ncbi:MAG: hypothetical protein K5790_05890 [Nitrosopumilus sp.]|uniref:hypothetical protein n=1 Tax=Nitrosopumilus sp. TaxID=2024843 RepID=UPI00247BAC80|nr:hypothetical protein [Nitrosopumilus sp.]MCV0392812.1 hypothetical protein [Nitrosopumilus sp.]